MTVRCLSVHAQWRLLVLLHFLSVVSGEGEVILAKLFLMLIVLHCVKGVYFNKLYIFTMPRSRSVDCIPGGCLYVLRMCISILLSSIFASFLGEEEGLEDSWERQGPSLGWRGRGEEGGTRRVPRGGGTQPTHGTSISCPGSRRERTPAPLLAF